MCGVADMKLLDFNVRLSVYVLNLRRLLSIVIRCASLFGVGGSGRSPVSPPTPGGPVRGEAYFWGLGLEAESTTLGRK